MVRNYIRKSNRQSWLEDDMKMAVLAVVERSLTYDAASIRYEVPRSTLQDRVNKVKKGKLNVQQCGLKALGHYQKVFSIEQENVLVQYLKDMESRLFGLTQNHFRKLAFELAERNNIAHNFNKTNGLAGQDWLKGFLLRHPELSVRIPEPTSAVRAMGFNRPVVNSFYDLLKKCYETHHFKPEQIFNVDESGLSNVAKSRAKIISQKGRRQVGKLSSAERGQNVTVTICFSASGSYIPPLLIFPRVRLNPDFEEEAPPGSLVVCHPSGWMQSEIFVQWLHHFIKHTHPTKENPILLLLDGHVTHVKNLEVIDVARKNNIVIICFPPHTTHKLQPLDVNFMGPLSTYYSQELDLWLLNHPGQVVGLRHISKIFREAYLKAATPKNAISGFRKTGIAPFNSDIFDNYDFAPAETTNNIEMSLDTQTQPCCSADNNSALALYSTPQPSSSANTLNTEQPADNVQNAAVSSLLSQSLVLETPHATFSSNEKQIFTISPEIILPIPKAQNINRSSRRRGKTAIITESPYKKELQEAKENSKPLPKKKQKKNNIKKRLFTSTDEEEIHLKKLCVSTDDDDSADEECIYCSMPYKEDSKGEKWVKCINCCRWCHELCGGVDNWKTYICDLCIKKK
ncbi:tigger transposable element-derived protein 6-like [Myzus persicae]|uniref:tigger transposable element-derived protein 6-like n=1 Tax=Myzus persicae TaxID=13164 RepID=UPI000B933B8D|nr:tigger transposable element-derived protein 6-like [Myzus persicae]XP_022166414.1 tigger transposable element-derived protein 6-like [Myzus persicae]